MYGEGTLNPPLFCEIFFLKLLLFGNICFFSLVIVRLKYEIRSAGAKPIFLRTYTQMCETAH